MLTSMSNNYIGPPCLYLEPQSTHIDFEPCSVNTCETPNWSPDTTSYPELAHCNATPHWCITLSQVSTHRGTNQLSKNQVPSIIYWLDRKQYSIKHHKRNCHLEKRPRKTDRRILCLSSKDTRIPPYPLYWRRSLVGVYCHQWKK